MLYVALTLPVDVAFVSAPSSFDAWSIINFCLDTLFVADIYVHFRTGATPCPPVLPAISLNYL